LGPRVGLGPLVPRIRASEYVAVVEEGTLLGRGLSVTFSCGGVVVSLVGLGCPPWVECGFGETDEGEAMITRVDAHKFNRRKI